MIKHFFTRQFLLFVFVGITAALMNWVARFVFSLWISFPLAVLSAYGIGMASAFELNRRFVFPVSPKPIHRQMQVFVLTNLAFLPVVWVASIFLNTLMNNYGFTRNTEEIAHGIALAIPMLITFLVYKFIAFGSK